MVHNLPEVVPKYLVVLGGIESIKPGVHRPVADACLVSRN